MKLPIYQIDAFAERPLTGNPAAVVPLERWLPEDLLQAIAAENNLSETAFFVPEEGGFQLRWFTPRVEVDLCGHATLASAWVVLHRLEPGAETVRFSSASGPLAVRKRGALLELDFPTRAPVAVEAHEDLARALGAEPAEVLATDRDYLVLLPDEQAVRGLDPDFRALARLDRTGVCATAPGEEADFCSRFFVPAVGIDEDPVTGSTHCMLTPYWAGRLGKRELSARQLSARGGALECALDGERVRIAGRARAYLEGTIEV